MEKGKWKSQKNGMDFFSSNIWETTHLSQSQDVLSISRARKGVDIIRVLVGLGAVGVAGLTGSLGAARVAGDSGETVLDEFRRSIHIDGGKIPVELVRVQSVLELENTVTGLSGGHLDRDATAVGVGLPLLAVGTTSRGDSVHVRGLIGGGPEVDVGAQVVHDLNITAGRVVTGTVGKSSGGGSQDAGDDNVGEDHFECSDCRVDKSGDIKTVMKRKFLFKRQ